MKKAIKEKGVKLSDIAERLEVNYMTVWKVLNGRLGIKPEFLAEVASMTNKTPNDFFLEK